MNEPVDAEEVDGELADLPREELAEAVTDALSAEAMVVSTAERHDGFVAMDAHDAARLVDRITRQAQEGHLAKRWVYELPYGGGRGLTVDAVEDITQLMNLSGLFAIGAVPESKEAALIDADEDGDPVKFWSVDIAAVDSKSGVMHMGTAMEPQRMKLKAETAKAKRKQGKPVPEDDRVFDKFARTKALNKAERNAMEKFIPEVVKLHVLAMAAKNPSIVERIETPEEAKLREMPPPLDTPEAKALLGECAAIYDEIRGLGGGKGAIELTPGRYHGMLMASQHDLVMLKSGRDWLAQRREELRAQFEGAS